MNQPKINDSPTDGPNHTVDDIRPDQPLAERVTDLPAVPKAFDLVPTNFRELMEYATQIAKSDLVPKDFRGKPENCLVAIQMGTDVGLRPMQALQNVAVINGRPVMWGDAVLAVVRASPAFDWIDERLSDDGKTAVCTVKRRGEEPISRSFSMADATTARLAGKDGPWKQYPRRMLQMRARSWALRDAFADLLKGFAIREELEGSTDIVAEASQPEPAPVTSSTATVRDKLPPTPAEDSPKAPKAPDKDKDKAAAPRPRQAAPKAGKAAKSADPDDGMNADEIAAMIAEAATVDDLELCLDLLNNVSDFKQKKRLAAAWGEKRESLSG